MNEPLDQKHTETELGKIIFRNHLKSKIQNCYDWNLPVLSLISLPNVKFYDKHVFRCVIYRDN